MVYLKTIEEHMTHLKAFLTVLNEKGITLKLRKCLSLYTRNEYLGHILSPGCLHIASKTCMMQPFTNVTQPPSFLGL